MSTDAAPVAKPAINPWLIAVVASIATFMEVLDTTITNVSLSHIAGSLAASQDESTWVLTSYLVANGIILPISGWLSNTLGRKRFFMLCIAGFTGASFLCGAATSLPVLIIFRLIQGLAGGGLQPTQQAIVLDSFPPEKRGAVFGITGITLIAAPIIGPTLGGWITDSFSWRWIFFINVPVGIIALLLVYRLIEDPPHAKAQGFKNIDFTGLAAIAFGLGALQIMLDKGQQDDWFDSNYIRSLAAFAAGLLSFAVWRLWHQPDPIVNLRLFRERGFRYGSMLIFFTGFVLYASSALLPLLVQSQFGYDATLAGLILSPGGIAIIFLMPVAGKLIGKFPAKYLVMVGITFCAIGCLYTSFVTPQTDYTTFVWMRVLTVLGLPFLFIPVSTLAFMNVPKGENNKASALFSLSRNLGGSVGIALVTSYLARRMQVNQTTLSGHLVPADPVYQQTLASITNSLLAQGRTAFGASQEAVGQIYQQLIKQASILAYADAFRLMFLCMIVGFVIAQFLPKNNPRAKAADTPPAH